jgi:CBS domain-containing protein
MWWPAIGGIVVGLGGLIFPRALGTGYDVIDSLLSGNGAWQLIAGVLIVKSIIWAFSLGSGTSGGILAPLLMIGGALGALFAPILPAVSVGAWPLIGMTALLSGSIGCPLTAAVLSLELTHNYALLLPVFVGSVTAHGFTVFFQRRSILTERISRRGHHLSREYCVDPLEVILVEQVMHSRIVVLPDSFTPAEASQWIESARNRDGNSPDGLSGGAAERRGQRLYPMVDSDGRLAGVMTRHDLAIFAGTGTPLQQPSPRMAPIVAHANEPLRVVAERMATRQLFVLPVIDPGSGKLLGLINTIDILQARARAHERETRLERLRMPFGRSRKDESAAVQESV